MLLFMILIWCFYTVLIAPFWMVLIPSILLIHWEFLSCFIFSSKKRLLCLFLASCLLPGPACWILPKRHPTWDLMTDMERVLLIWLTIIPFSLSEPPPSLPSEITWNLSLDSAKVSIRSWTSSEASPKAPNTRPFRFPNSSSLLSTGPLSPAGVLIIFWSTSLAFFLYSPGRSCALLLTALTFGPDGSRGTAINHFKFC